MSQQETPLSPTTEGKLAIILELVASNDAEADPALISAIGRETVVSLQQDGYTWRPVYTGQRGGPFLVEVIHTLGETAASVWANRAGIEEALNDSSALVTIFGGVLAVIKRLSHSCEQKAGTDESQSHPPVKIEVEIDGAQISVEAPDVTQADAALTLARRFIAAHPREATQVNSKSKVKVQGHISPRLRRRRK